MMRRPWLERQEARVAAAVRHAVTYAAGFLREHAPESSVRLCMVMFAATACFEAHRIVSFAFVNPTAHETVLELIGVLTVLVGTGVGSMALRTRSAASAAALANQVLTRAAEGLPASSTETPAGSGEHP
ncbi:MAG TPA: hypothetical protein VHB25_08615 [Gemmatimonadaceae bacterium]|nr:hypothetical protein [Gemmatimonadaceae bacterium]